MRWLKAGLVAGVYFAGVEIGELSAAGTTDTSALLIIGTCVIVGTVLIVAGE